MKQIKSLLAAVVAMLQPIRLMANAFPPKEYPAGMKATTTPPDPAATSGKTVASPAEAGKGSSPDPGTGKTTDYRALVMSLLGLGTDVDDNAVLEAYNAAMATEPDEATAAIKGKLDEVSAERDAGAENLEAAKGENAELEKEFGEEKAANEVLKARLVEKEELIANEQPKLQARAEAAEAAFANERNERITLLVANAISTGRITKAQGDDKTKELANAKDEAAFTAIVSDMANAKSRYQMNSTTENLGRTIAPGTASHEFLTMVNEAHKADPKHDFNWHWTTCGKSEKGKSLLASMKQPENKLKQ